MEIRDSVTNTDAAVWEAPMLQPDNLWCCSVTSCDAAVSEAPMLQCDKCPGRSMRTRSFLIKIPPSARGAARCHGNVVRVLASPPPPSFSYSSVEHILTGGSKQAVRDPKCLCKGLEISCNSLRS
jgi:hypothetical protein